MTARNNSRVQLVHSLKGYNDERRNKCVLIFPTGIDSST